MRDIHRPSLAAPLVSVMILTACGAAATSASTSPSASVAPTRAPAPTSTPTSTPSEPPASPTVAHTPRPVVSHQSFSSWRMTASFDTAPATSYATDVAAWSGGFVAIGSAWETEFHVTGEMPAIWTSVDGESWVAQPVDIGVDNVSLIGIAPRADGRLLMVGKVPGTGAMPDQPSPASVAWVSDDARNWEAVGPPWDGIIDD